MEDYIENIWTSMSGNVQLVFSSPLACGEKAMESVSTSNRTVHGALPG